MTDAAPLWLRREPHRDGPLCKLSRGAVSRAESKVEVVKCAFSPRASGATSFVHVDPVQIDILPHSPQANRLNVHYVIRQIQPDLACRGEGSVLAHAIANGAHPKSIQERMGHSSITVTLDRHGHLFQSLGVAVADALEAMYSSIEHASVRRENEAL
jgi:hypothetical protein